jgi:L-fuconolactonase
MYRQAGRLFEQQRPVLPISDDRVTMHIDAHQHFWIYNSSEYAWLDDRMASLRRDFLPEDLQTELDRSEFQGCVAVQVRQTIEETNWLLRLASESSFVLGVVGWVDLRSPQLQSELQALTDQPKLVGVRHIVQSEPDDHFLLQPDFLRGVSLLEEQGLAYDILIYEQHLPVAVEFVRKFPRQRFVLDHLAKPRIREKLIHPWAERIRELAVFPNVYCKLSGLVTEADWEHWEPEQLTPYLDVAMECFGSDRLMIGSDWPVCTVAASHTRAVDAIRQYLDRFPAAVREQVLGANAQRFYKLTLSAD